MHLTLIEREYFEIKCEPLEDYTYTVLCTLVLYIYRKNTKKVKNLQNIFPLLILF